MGGDTLGFGCMILTLIIVWLALQIPLGALIGTFLERGMAQPRRREEALTGVAPLARVRIDELDCKSTGFRLIAGVCLIF